MLLSRKRQQANKVRVNKEQQADSDLKKILQTPTDEVDSAPRWPAPGAGSLQGAGPKMRRTSHGSMSNLTIIHNNGSMNGGAGGNYLNVQRPNNAYRHSVHLENYTEGEDEILESLVRSTTQQPVRTLERNRRKARFGDRKSRKSPPLLVLLVAPQQVC